MIEEIEGESNETGFKIIVNEKIFLSEESYVEKSENSVKEPALYPIFLIIMTAATILSYVLLDLPLHIHHVIIVPLFCILISTIIILFIKKRFRQWRAMEHKVYNLFKNFEQLDIKNINIATLKNTPSYSTACGSRFIFPIIVSLGVIIYILPFLNLNGFWLNCLGIIAASIIGYLLSALFLNKLLQNIFLLSEPNDEQYMIGLKLTKKIIDFFYK